MRVIGVPFLESWAQSSRRIAERKSASALPITVFPWPIIVADRQTVAILKLLILNLILDMTHQRPAGKAGRSLGNRGSNRIKKGEIRGVGCTAILQMQCPVKIRLIDEFAAATTDYFRAASELASVAETNGRGLCFSELYERAKQERERCERARQAVKQHCTQHHC
jgi:hypothetical protein